MDFCKKVFAELGGTADSILTIDSHTAGEFTRLVVGGVGEVPGRTMAAKLAYFQQEYDHIRQLLTYEPRGCGLVAVATEPVNAGSSFGLLYMDARRYPYLCGHATIGAVVTLAATGFLDLAEGENPVAVDTPSGVMSTTAVVTDGKLASVAVNMVPSFVLATDQALEVPGFGRLHIDLVCVGGFFAMVSAAQTGIEPVSANAATLADLGMKIIQAANEQVEVFHPERPEVTTVDVAEFYAPHAEGVLEGKGIVVYGESHVDRSPCGTGTTAKLTLLHHQHKIGLHEPYTNYSPLGTAFQARLVKTLKVGDFGAVVARIEGMAYITGTHRFWVTADDPFPRGFLLPT